MNNEFENLTCEDNEKYSYLFSFQCNMQGIILPIVIGYFGTVPLNVA